MKSSLVFYFKTDEAKKKKNEKKTQNGHITQKQQKGSKQKSKRGKGIFGKSKFSDNLSL